MGVLHGQLHTAQCDRNLKTRRTSASLTDVDGADVLGEVIRSLDAYKAHWTETLHTVETWGMQLRV